MLHITRLPSLSPCRELAGLDLAGTLPPDLLTLSQLQVLNLSSNSFTGTLPPQWSSLTLTQLDLSNNLLSGPLPVAYGSKETFPQLTKIFLQGNQFSGAMPGPEWTSYGFAAQAVITLRPGNWGLCGPVAIVDPRFYTTMPSGQDGTALLGPKSVSSTGVTSNTSQAYIVYSGLLGGTGIEPGVSAPPTTNVVVTNTLGSCADPCGRTAPLLTNIYDATWQNNVSLSDLVTYNPGLSVATAYPGMLLALPCYPAWLEPQTFNSDAAQGMFAGGNQQSVMGTVGAELAGGVVNPGGLNDSTTFYEGSRDWKYAPDGTMSAYLVEPVYWFVKLEATFTMSAMTITAGDAMSGITLYIGTDQAIVQGNREISSNMDFAPGESRVVPTGYVRGNMIILWAGYATEGNMSLANVKVWPAEGNAALNKPVYASSSPPDLNTTTDGSLTSCSYVKADNTGSAWFVVDLGYTADVATVVFTLQGGAENGTAQAFVSSDPSKSAVSNSTACGILPGAPWTERIGLECDKTGRYVGILAEGMDGFKVCELEVFLAGEKCVRVRFANSVLCRHQPPHRNALPLM